MLLLIASIIIGISIGLLLSKIAFEELEESKKNILFLKRIIFLNVVILSSYSLLLNFNILLLVVIVILVINFIFKIKTKNIKLEIVNYILFSIIYFLINNTEKDIIYILVSLILFYGIPLGSLMHLHFIGESKEDKKNKKNTKDIIKKIKRSHKNQK